MEKKEKNNREYYAIDVMQILKALWQRAWIIVLSGFIAAGIGFSYASFMITPTYSSSIMLYVNNSKLSLGDTTFTIGDINAAKSLVNTYSVMLKNRTTLERVIEKTGVSYDYESLSGMISAKAVSETEIMRVTVESTDPYEAAKIANCIAEILPVRISEIIDGASMEVVDSAIPNLNKIAPSITKYTAVGLVLGVVVSVLILSVSAMMDDTIHSEEYIIQTYDYPILAKIPDLMETGTKRYGYYYKYGTRVKKKGDSK
ncbi:MAG: hypothetical protein E7672_09005 [Ruminococcaceae bacterium]|nr:hypothetical protein [Oscillospiraceae bacterium]